MGSPTYRTKGLVLKRTKLGETDVICTILAENGSQIRAVAKGARKPSLSLSSRVELFSISDLLLAKGKSLDIIKEARLIEGNASIRSNFEAIEAASPMVELLDRVTLDSLENPKIFLLTQKALETISKSNTNPSSLIVICAAHLLKAVSFLGFKPQLVECIGCDNSDEVDQALAQGRLVAFSVSDGGLVCRQCCTHFETQWIDPVVLRWAQTLLYSTFDQIESFDLPPHIQLALLRFMQSWIKVHVGYSLKSLTYIFRMVCDDNSYLLGKNNGETMS